jgi:exodeoxyribonuclease VII small subunit
MADKNQKTKQFEVALEELEGIVEQLESGELSLEDSLAVFEKGVGLVKYCNQKLTEVEKKIEVLIKDKEGKLQLKALELGTGGERKEPDE